MTSRRFQFSLRTLLVLILCVACFFGGMSVQRRMSSKPEPAVRFYPLIGPAKLATLPDGTKTFERLRQPIETDGEGEPSSQKIDNYRQPR